MKEKLLIGLFIGLLLAGMASATNWYIDNSVATSGNGQSWNSPWKSFTNIQWSSIQPGDTIYLSGGTTSQTYYEKLVLPTGQDGLTITRGVEAGHNGEVIFDGQNSLDRGIGIYANSNGVTSKDITISHLTFKSFTWSGVYGTGEHGGGIQNILVDNCRFIDFRRAGAFFEGDNGGEALRAPSNNITVRNSYFNDDDSFSTQSDGIYIQNLHDFTADHNTIIIDNPIPYTGDIHSDNIQSFWVDNIVYSNNIILQKSDTKILGTQLLFADEGNGVHKIYNNVIFSDSPMATDAVIRIKNAGTATFHAEVYGNSVFSRNNLNLKTDDPTTTIKNNIFEYLGTGYYVAQYASRDPGAVADYNVYYSPNGGAGKINGGLGAHDIVGNPLYTNTDGYATADLSLQAGSPAIDEGSNLGVPYKIAIDGTSRPQGSAWDIGAYEYSTGGTGCAPADSNCDGCISLNEVSSYVSQWLSGQITLSEVSTAVASWLGGCQ